MDEHKKQKSKQIEDSIGNAIGSIFYIMFIFYLVCGIAGIVAYIFEKNTILYIDTILILISFLIQYGLSIRNSIFGIIWIIVGAVLGFWFLKTLRGICLGIMIAVIIRHIFKEIFFKLFGFIINWSSRQ